MRLKAWSAGNVGNQDRSLSAAAVLVEQSATATQLQETNAAGTTIVQSQVGTNALVVSAGAYVKDVATVTPNTATGSVAFRYYSGADAAAAIAACNADATPPSGGTAVTGGTVSGGTATSAVVQFTTPGFFAWRAFFDGTGIFEDSASNCSNEVLQVQIVTTSLSTTPKVLPNDSATVSATAGGNVAGSVKFRLYDSSANCNADPPSDLVGTGGLLYKETVSLPGDATSSTVSTSNTTVEVSANATVYWLVEFTSTNAAHQGRESVCVENVALTGDAGPGTAP
jgi:hypothetical protein